MFGVFALSASLFAGCATTRPDLERFGDPEEWKILNGEVERSTEMGRKIARLAPVGGNRKGSNLALALVRGLDFTEGSVDVDLRGGGEAQASFLGIAFGAVDETSHEAVYFRPFNFRSEDPDRRAHAVQYVAEPDFPWERLRRERTGLYERPLDPAPDPARWFHARIEIAARHVAVYVDGAEQPALSVDRLVERPGGGGASGAIGAGRGIGLWVDSQPGEFANLRIRRRR